MATFKELLNKERKKIDKEIKEIKERKIYLAGELHLAYLTGKLDGLNIAEKFEYAE